MTRIADEACIPCREGSVPLTDAERQQLHTQVPDWQIETDAGIPRLVREFRFRNFTSAMRFAVAVGRVADEQDHHPELVVTWGRTQVRWWTHAIGGLHRNDFVMAAKTDEVYADEAGASA